MKLHQQIKTRRKELKMSQKELAKLAKVSQGELSRFENGKMQMGSDRIDLLLFYLNL